jgi:transglutaminase-like putative cysteine protease
MLDSSIQANPGFSPQDELVSDSNQMPPQRCARMEIDCTLAYQVDGSAEFIFLVHAAVGVSQSLLEESLVIEPATSFRTYSDPRSGNRFLRLQAETGPLRVTYRAVVARTYEPIDICAPEMPVHDIPDNVMRFLMPTRYCESDHLGAAAQKLFGALPQGYSRVLAISDWVRANIDYRIGSTNATTTARDVFVQRSGVCRDFAHLCVTFCRALNIPARLVCGYCAFPEPPPDFHAIFEAYLGGQWIRFDPSGMAPVEHVVRIAAGRDAKDVAFATIYGPARMTAMSPEIKIVAEYAVMPQASVAEAQLR